MAARDAREYSQNGPPDEPEGAVENGVAVGQRGPAERDRNREPEHVADSQGDEHGAKPKGSVVLALAEERVSDVTAVQLTPRQEIQHRDEEAGPSSQRGPRQEDVMALGNRSIHDALEQGVE